MSLSEICVTVGGEKCEDRTTLSDFNTVSFIIIIGMSTVYLFLYSSQYVCLIPLLPDEVTEADVVVKEMSAYYVT